MKKEFNLRKATKDEMKQVEEFNLSVCPICGKKFKKHYSQICCSDRCKKERKRQQAIL